MRAIDAFRWDCATRSDRFGYAHCWVLEPPLPAMPGLASARI